MLGLAVVGLALCGCQGITRLINSDLLLSEFNSPSDPTDAGSVDCTQLTFATLEDTIADVYDTAGALAPLHDADDRVAGKLSAATGCVARAQAQQADDQACFDCLFGTVSCADSLRFPPVPTGVDPAAWQQERDVQRLQFGLSRAVRTVANTCLITRGPDTVGPEQLQVAWARGVQQLLAYQQARPRTVRDGAAPVTAWVLAGGSANGAFSAGAVWWLLNLREACPGGGCAGDRVDLLGGASTGTLISTIAKNYFNPGVDQLERGIAMKDLVSKYTCSTNGALYCAQGVSVYDLVFNPKARARGLINFNGVRALLREKTGDLKTHIRSAPEMFASTVDFESGQVFHESSAQISSREAWAQALEASIVEPLLAEPVKQIGKRKGTWIDGGVRSGLPLSAALRRGADRAVVFVNGPFQGISKPMPNGASIALRAIDLFSLQPILGELAEAEAERGLKRLGEKDRCLERLGFDQAGAGAVDIEHRCSRATALPGARGLARAAKSMGPVTVPSTPVLDRIEDAYRSSWVFMPTALQPGWQASLVPLPGRPTVEWKDIGAAGYTFDPNQMWNLFVVGAFTAFERCEELNATLSWHLSCPKDEAAVHAQLKLLRAGFEADKCGSASLAVSACTAEDLR
jgi:predicted acylesterase/phospholipase RssA